MPKGIKYWAYGMVLMMSLGLFDTLFPSFWEHLTDFLENFPASKVFFITLTVVLIIFAFPVYRKIKQQEENPK